MGHWSMGFGLVHILSRMMDGTLGWKSLCMYRDAFIDRLPYWYSFSCVFGGLPVRCIDGPTVGKLNFCSCNH